MMIETERLTIRIVSDDRIREMIEEQTDNEMKKAYGEMLAGCIAYPDQRQWYAPWLAELHSGEAVGDLCFKGLSADGSVEIGYGFAPAYWGQGYATEAVTAMAAWALGQPGVKTVEAETEPENFASRRVLEKAGFVPNGLIGEEGPRFVWKGE